MNYSEALRTLLSTQYHLSNEQLKDMGLDKFHKRLIHQANGGGIARKATGVKINDPLLENERGTFRDIIHAHPLLQELSHAVKQFQREFGNESISDDKATAFANTLGTGEDLYDESLYSQIYTAYRKHMLAQNDGAVTMPEQLTNVAKSAITLVNTFNQKPCMSSEEKMAAMSKFSNDISKQFSDGFLTKIAIYTSGFIEGVKVARKEKHEASIFEAIGQVFKAGVEFAQAKHSNFLSYKAAVHKIRDETIAFVHQSEQTPPAIKNIAAQEENLDEKVGAYPKNLTS